MNWCDWVNLELVRWIGMDKPWLGLGFGGWSFAPFVWRRTEFNFLWYLVTYLKFRTTKKCELLLLAELMWRWSNSSTAVGFPVHRRSKWNVPLPCLPYSILNSSLNFVHLHHCHSERFGVDSRPCEGPVTTDIDCLTSFVQTGSTACSLEWNRSWTLYFQRHPKK